MSSHCDKNTTPRNATSHRPRYPYTKPVYIILHWTNGTQQVGDDVHVVCDEGTLNPRIFSSPSAAIDWGIAHLGFFWQVAEVEPFPTSTSWSFKRSKSRFLRL